jgi:hypothetical protein
MSDASSIWCSRGKHNGSQAFAISGLLFLAA